MNIAVSIAAEELFTLGGVHITNSLFIGGCVSVLLMIVFVAVLARKKEVPGRFQSLVEATFEGGLQIINGVMQNMEHSRRVFPVAMTIFFFVLFSNWAGLLPGAGTIGIEGVHGGHATIIPFVRSTSADLNFTIALSVMSVLMIQVVGILTLGLRGYAKKFFVSPFHKPYVIGTVIGFLELISEASKLLSFSFRLFGNIFAGEVLLTVVLHLTPYFFPLLPLPFYMLEVFVGLIQAVVFAMLTVVFMKMAMTEAQH